MLKVQECSGAVGMAQPVKKCKRQRGTQLQQLEGYTQCWKPRGSRACPWPAKYKSSSVTRSTASLLHKNASGSGGDLFVGTAKRVSPQSEAGREGCTWHHSLQWQRGNRTALCCGQQLAMATTLRGWKSVCIIISWVCMLQSYRIWFPEKDLSLYF